VTTPGRRPAPTRHDLAAAAGRTIPDLVADSLDVLFCGINPGLWSGWTGRHFARPGNRFWAALHRSGFTPRLFGPEEQEELLALGLGITNLAPRATARADELTAAELRAGGARLVTLVRRHRPRWLAVVGVSAYRTAFGVPGAQVGPAPPSAPPDVAPTRLWVLPNPSGLNAHYTVDRLGEEFSRLRAAVRTGQVAD